MTTPADREAQVKSRWLLETQLRDAISGLLAHVAQIEAERDQLHDLCLRAWRHLDLTEPNADITSELFNYLAEHRNLGAEGIAAGYARKDET